MQYSDYTDRIAAVRGKDIPVTTIKEIFKLFDAIEDKYRIRDMEQITTMIETYENVPSNIYGLIKRIRDDIKYRRDQALEHNENWKADPTCANSKEFAAFFAVLGEIMLWHELKLVQSNPDGIMSALNIQEWKSAGCPKTWSPLLDHFLQGYLKIYTASPPALENYLNNYNKLLVEKRLSKQTKLTN
jgi:hypothetical protein